MKFNHKLSILESNTFFSCLQGDPRANLEAEIEMEDFGCEERCNASLDIIFI